MSVNFSLSKVGLEVYTTTSETTKSSDGTSNLKLQTGDITRVDYIGEIYSDSFENDYSDISSNASISVPLDYINYFFKGRKIALKKGLQTDNTLKWEDMSTVCFGFITEMTYNQKSVDIKISGADTLLNQNAKFTFKKLKRSKIVKKIIEKSGLKAKVDVTGLKDDVTDFTNESSTSTSKDSNSNSEIDTSTELGKLVAKIVGDETDEKKKLDLLHGWGQDHITYDGYECSRYDCDPEKCYKNRGHLNCGDTSVLMNALYNLANLKAWIIHGNYHFWNIIEIGNKKYASDCSGTHSLNEVWSTSAHPNTPFKGSKANPKAICG